LSRTHVHALRRIPYAIAALLLDLVPLVLFCIAAALVLRALAAHTPHVHAVIEGFLQAYVTTRVIMALLRLLVYPDARALRMLQVQDDTAQTLQLWVRRIVVLAAFGLAFCDAVLILGAGEAVRLALLKAISLIVHIMAVVLVWRMQRPVADAIRAPAERGGSIAAMRFWLANSWAVLATVFIMGAWVVWALGVADGFPKLVHFIAESVGVIILARLIAVFALGAVERLFMPRGKRHPHGDAGTAADAAANEAGPQSDRRLLNPRYYASVRWLVSLVICVGALVALMQSWGFDAVSWFAPGTLGGGLASAAGTILVAIALAVLVWEVANARIENRLRRWQTQGDMVRAARLRTLLPMLRTALLVIVILVVGLTALNQIGINTTPLLAGASIVGVALGFGSQKLVQDFITGIFLLMENAMQVGDWVTVAGVSGSVEYLSIRTVRLRGGDGSLNIVPFSSVSTVNNVNRGLGNAAMRVSLGYGVDVQTVLDELKKIGADLRQDPAFKDVILADMEVWGVDAVDGSMWTVAGQIRCTDKGRWGVQREINRRVLERFRELGIEIANPRSSLLMLPQEPSGHEGPPVPPRSGEKTDGAGDCHQK
jgi:small-conductance mechanosensitive channel